MLIGTLPQVIAEEQIRKIVSNRNIGAVRYNTGNVTPYSPKETLARIKEITDRFGVGLIVDLKGRQLRVKHWAAANWGRIILNHEIETDYPAYVYFRGEDCSEIKFAKGREIFVDPRPRSAIGEGQAINVHGPNLRIKGYSTRDDFRYIKAACELGIYNFMLSFVEKEDDVAEVENAIRVTTGFKGYMPLVNLWCKIESPAGLEFADEAELGKYRYVAARDDMMINIGDNKAEMITALQMIKDRDPRAICASRIFSSLEMQAEVAMGDISDLYLMMKLGYRNFMFSDGICIRHFDRAIKAWEDCLNTFGDKFEQGRNFMEEEF